MPQCIVPNFKNWSPEEQRPGLWDAAGFTTTVVIFSPSPTADYKIGMQSLQAALTGAVR